jgi:hypothetical protein
MLKSLICIAFIACALSTELQYGVPALLTQIREVCLVALIIRRLKSQATTAESSRTS